jgi:hypothetical protein
VQFDFVTKTRGLDYIEEIRRDSEPPRPASVLGESNVKAE